MKYKITLALLKGISALPFGILYIFSDVISFIVFHILKYRRKIVYKNLTESFPLKSRKEINQIAKNYYRFLGDMIVETLKLLNISDYELKKRFQVVNPDSVNASLEEGKSAAIFMGHYGNWEWVQEIGTYFTERAYRASIYRPLGNKLWDKIYKEIRGRWHMHIVEQNKALKIMLNKDNQPWVFGFIADQRPRHVHPDNWVNFLNHETAFFTGPEDIGRKVGADFFYLDMYRIKRGYYKVEFKKLRPVDMTVSYPYSREFWKLFEKTIERNPALWLWSHNRWKYPRSSS